MNTPPATGEPARYPGYPGYRGYVGYEYLTVTTDRDLEPLYADTYRSFGWIIESTTTSVPNLHTVTIKLKRDRDLRNRPLVTELQRKAENALTAIRDLEKSRTTAATCTALAIGVTGSAFLAGSVFAIEADLWALSIPLGGIGLLGWLAGYLAHGRVKSRKTAQTTPLIEAQYEIVYKASEQASRLLA
ncbi:MAG: hypothetical protein AAGC63_08950 [Propionicimonas sp.]|nr:hypothetical protein [Propionicimonas sp.]